MSLTAGAHLGHYEILAAIGAGGMGEVYRARDTKLNRDVALKVLPEAFTTDPERLARFKREAHVLASLNHPNIAAIHGFEESDGVRALVLELVDGPTLADRIAGEPLSVDEVVSIARQICDALESAHEQGIVHRDLKPANVKVKADETVKVLDFGLAKAAAGDAPGRDLTQSPTVTTGGTREGVILGTAAYMSPEQARGRSVDKRTDVWAFGCVLYEMLTGRPPFGGETLADVLGAIVGREPDWRALPDATPPSIRRLLQRCLTKDPRRRLHDIADARIEIDDALAGTDIERDGSRPRGVSRRARLLALVGAAGASALLTVALARSRATVTAPVYHQITFRGGTAGSARFTPEGQTIVYSAAWEGRPVRLFSTRIDSPESMLLPIDGAELLSVSSAGRMAVRLLDERRTLAELPLAGQAPRELLNNVDDADWSPRGDSLVVSHLVDGRTRLEYPAGTVLYDPGGSRQVAFPRFSPNGDLIAFADFETAAARLRFRVGVVDLSGRVRILSEGWSDLYGLAWAANGDELWFSARERETRSGGLILHAVMLSGQQRVVARIPGLPIIQHIRRDGRVLLKHDNWPATMMCRSAGDEAERSLSWLDHSVARDISPDGRFVVFREDGLAEGPKGAVYIRKTDGSPAVRLGDGQPLALSPDGTAVVTIERESPEHLRILPTGPGKPRTLDGGTLTYTTAVWFPDGRRLLVGGREPGQPAALYVQDVGGGAPQRVVNGTDQGVVSADGQTVAAIDSRGVVTLTRLNGATLKSMQVSGLPPGAALLTWSSSPQEIFASTPGIPSRILRLNVQTARAEPWLMLGPDDLSGVRGLREIALTPDGRSYCYSYVRYLSTLFVVDGLK